MGADVLVRCDKLVIGYRGRPLLPPCDLEIRRGSFVALVGRNGSGKTTFVRTILGLQPPIAGRVARAHSSVRMAYVGQGASLERTLPLRARDVVAWGLLSGWSFLRPSGTDHRVACEKALAEMGIANLADRPFRDLSEGQKQRVQVARMLVASPDAAFFDEPTAAMDAVAESQALAHMSRLAKERKMAIVVISHAIGIAARFADVLVFLDRDEALMLSGPPREILAHPSFERQLAPTESRHG